MTRTSVPLGLAMAFASASVYALNAIAATLAYGEGMNAITFIWIRLVLSLLVLTPVILGLRQSFRVQRGAWLPLVGVAAGIFGMGYGYLSAIAFIPVSLAVLIFYTFPLLVAAAEALVDRRPLGPVKLACYLLAFCGLALSLGPSFDSLDWRGIALATGGALSAVVCLLASRKLAFAVQPMPVAFYTALLSLAATSLLIVTIEPMSLPTTGFGWVAGLTGCVFYVMGLMLQFLAIRHISAGQLAMMYNFEPALTVPLAMLFLGASLTGVQLIGVCLILVALFVSTRRAR